MYQRVKKLGMSPTQYQRMMSGNVAPMAPSNDYSGYVPSYSSQQPYTGYNDGDVSYMDTVNKIARSYVMGPNMRTTTGNQVFSSYLPNPTQNISRGAYLGARLFNELTPQTMSNAEKLDLLSDRAKLQKVIAELPEGDGRTQLEGMASRMRDYEDSGLKKAAKYAGKAAAAGLTGIGLVAENFWPMHDMYYRYKTQARVGRAMGNAADYIMGLLPVGHGYRRRKGRKNKKRSKVRYGGMIIPPQSLKKMFEKNKCNCNK